MKALVSVAVLAAALLTGACGERADAQAAAPASTAASEGGPYVLTGTQVWSVPDPVSGRQYEVFVSLPADYEAHPERRYPVLYVTDADYAFPVIRSIARRVNLDGPVLEDFILVGLSYARGDSGADSRRRDYTPTPNGPNKAVHGQGAAYQAYLKSQVLPFVEGRFRADPARRVLLGHSYGGLLGAQILLTDPTLFHGYVLGSPSFWYDQRHVMKMEAAYARAHRDLPAEVFMYVGGFETIGPGPRQNRTNDLVGDMAAFERVLKSRRYRGLHVRSVVLDGEDHLTVAPVGFTRALMAVLPAKADAGA
ncbi:alpha/beta hydrolase [Caulobacter sp. 17J80-11]|uniref:alpha/beta hydrolase n=1 Tax=Caulobacter sp. 17J80-11 TaxID=2763502 RepID=UPI001653A8EA|nr:alpha/beta hydrolase-fold protein [Caulobacter sp. 17J80-11]MBC6982349.1 alpha/beta hydrolase [Caulobacter sp. 17J80-11]